jgi:type I restriction enzyme S subunit
MTVVNVSLSKLIASRVGSVDPSKFPDEVFDLYSIPAFDKGAPEIAVGTTIGSSKQIVRPGDVLLSKIVPHIRRSWVVGVDRGRRLIASGEWIVFRGEQIHQPYLRHVLIGDTFHAQFMQTVSGVGGSLLRARPAQVALIDIPLPPLPEQRRIAAILDQADALRAKRREALALLDSLTQSIFIEMFGDPVANSKRWLTAPLNTHVSKLGSGSTPTGGDAAYKESGISLIRSLNVHDGEFKYKNLAFIDAAQAGKLSNVVVAEGDVLLNITGASVARVCSVPSDVLPARVNQHVMIIRPKPTLNRLFLERLLLNSQMKTKLLQIGGAGATREAITKAQAEELVIPIPPIQIQNEFAARLSVLLAIKASHRSALAELNTLFASLQHRAFRGEL